MNQILVACFCAVASVVLLILSIWLSSEGTPGDVWLTLLMGLALFLVGVLALRERADG